MTSSSPKKLPWRVFSVNCTNSIDLVWLFGYQFLRYVEHLFHCEIFCILEAMQIVWVILHHEYRCLQCRRQKHSPYYRMFVDVLCCTFLRIGPASIALDHSPWARMIWIPTTCLILLQCKNSSYRFQQRVYPCAVRLQQVALFIFHQFIRFPPLRRPIFVVIPSWVACWVHVTTNNECPRSIIFLSFRTPRILTFKTFLPRAFWRRRWRSWGNPCNQTYHWPRLRYDSFFTWFCWRSFSQHSRTNCGTEMDNDGQKQKKIPFITYEIPFVSMSANWVFGVHACTWFGFLGPKWFYQTNNQEQICASWKHVSLWDFFPL